MRRFEEEAGIWKIKGGELGDSRARGDSELYRKLCTTRADSSCRKTIVTPSVSRASLVDPGTPPGTRTARYTTPLYIRYVGHRCGGFYEHESPRRVAFIVTLSRGTRWLRVYIGR